MGAMGNGGKWRERERARELRAQSWTLQAIANQLGVAKGTVSVWVRDIIDFTPNPRNRGHSSMKPHPMSRVLDVQSDQFQKPYRAVDDPSRRSAKHVHGCATLVYASTNLHRRVLAMIEAVSCRFVIPG